MSHGGCWAVQLAQIPHSCLRDENIKKRFLINAVQKVPVYKTSNHRNTGAEMPEDSESPGVPGADPKCHRRLGTIVLTTVSNHYQRD